MKDVRPPAQRAGRHFHKSPLNRKILLYLMWERFVLLRLRLVKCSYYTVNTKLAVRFRSGLLRIEVSILTKLVVLLRLRLVKCSYYITGFKMPQCLHAGRIEKQRIFWKKMLTSTAPFAIIIKRSKDDALYSDFEFFIYAWSTSSVGRAFDF